LHPKSPAASVGVWSGTLWHDHSFPPAISAGHALNGEAGPAQPLVASAPG